MTTADRKFKLLLAIAAFLLIAMLGLSIAAFIFTRSFVENQSRSLLNRAAQSISGRILSRFDFYTHTLRSAQALLNVDENLTQEDWQHFFQSQADFQEYGIENIQFVRPDSAQTDIYTIPYTVGAKKASESLGTDALKKLLTGRAPNEPIFMSIVMGTDKSRRDYVLGIPIYGHEGSQSKPLLGFALLTFDAKKYLDDLFSARIFPYVDVKIYEGSQIRPENLIFKTSHLASGSTLRQKQSLDLPSQIWTVQYEASDRFGFGFSGKFSPFIVLAGGLIFSVFLFIFIFRIITEQLRTEQLVEERTRELAVARDEAYRASEAKSEFLATMSHEIRTPLNSILGMADLLAETKLSEEQIYFSKTLQRSTDSLLNLVNDILDLSKIEASQLELEEINFNLRDLLERTFEVVALKAHQKGLEIGFHIKEGIPLDWRGDPNRLRQVIVNLLGNAIKFTNQGQIFLEVALEDSQNAQGQQDRLLFAISDTGVGIPKDKLDLIFEPFKQADSSTTRKFGGTGLGLNISKKLVEAMGGRIWAESEEGKGTRFLFAVCLAPVESSGEFHKNLEVSDKSILIVDSSSMNCFVLKELMKELGVKADEAKTSEECFSKILSKQYDYIFVSCRMPKMDGFQIADEIHAKTSANPPRLMLLLPQNFRKDDIAKAREHGFKRVLTKPVKMGELKSALHIMEDLGKEGSSSEVVAKAQEFHGRPLKILLVDDSEDNLTLMQFYLKSTPHEIQTAMNGEEALEKFRAGNFDLVFMDMHMPVMDGYESTRRIRAWEKKSQAKDQPVKTGTPIIALTADAIKTNVQKGLEAGCNAHLTKPIRKEILIGLISEYAK